MTDMYDSTDRSQTVNSGFSRVPQDAKKTGSGNQYSNSMPTKSKHAKSNFNLNETPNEANIALLDSSSRLRTNKVMKNRLDSRALSLPKLNTNRSLHNNDDSKPRSVLPQALNASIQNGYPRNSKIPTTTTTGRKNHQAKGK